ncbi:MAG: WecB/TagA/CpsF family glycosyltransferase, partial [Pyrinomonadaceae bacterium]
AVSQAPAWIQRRGFEWLYRFVQEPRRLWKRYTVLNALYLVYVGLQLARFRTRAIDDTISPKTQMRFG